MKKFPKDSFSYLLVFFILILIAFSKPGYSSDEEDPARNNQAEADSATLEIGEVGQDPRFHFAYNPSIHHHRPRRKITKNLGLSFNLAIYSRYVWRGLLSSLGAVWQPSISLEAYGVGFNVWGNFPMVNGPNKGEFNEIDFTLYYHNKIRKLAINTWFIFDVYPNGNPTSLDDGTKSLEWDIHLSHPIGPISLFTDFSVRIISAPGSIFWDFGVGYREELPLKFAVETSVMFALGNGRFNRANIADVGTQANLFEFSLAFPWAPVEGFTITPRMYVSTLLPDALRDAVAHPTLVWGGVTFYYALGKVQ